MSKSKIMISVWSRVIFIHWDRKDIDYTVVGTHTSLLGGKYPRGADWRLP